MPAPSTGPARHRHAVVGYRHRRLSNPATQTTLAAALGQRESAQVGALQGILISTGYYTGTVDGQWSPAVEDALKALQTDLGVEATGVVDAATLRAFEAALEEAGQPPVTTSSEPGATTPPTVATTTAGAETTTTAAPDTTVAPITTVAPTTTVASVSGGILDALADSGQFSQLLASIEAAGLTETLTGPGPLTLFALPTRRFRSSPNRYRPTRRHSKQSCSITSSGTTSAGSS